MSNTKKQVLTQMEELGWIHAKGGREAWRREMFDDDDCHRAYRVGYDKVAKEENEESRVRHPRVWASG